MVVVQRTPVHEHMELVALPAASGQLAGLPPHAFHMPVSAPQSAALSVAAQPARVGKVEPLRARATVARDALAELPGGGGGGR